MPQVWLVESGSYSTYTVRAVAATRALAETQGELVYLELDALDTFNAYDVAQNGDWAEQLAELAARLSHPLEWRAQDCGAAALYVFRPGWQWLAGDPVPSVPRWQPTEICVTPMRLLT